MMYEIVQSRCFLMLDLLRTTETVTFHFSVYVSVVLGQSLTIYPIRIRFEANLKTS